MARGDDLEIYDEYIQRMRIEEYPMLKESLYLDHAGTTLYSKTQMNRFHSDMVSNLYGNPHSMSPSSQKATQEVENVRIQALQFFGADPELFDLVFTSNTTAAIKLILEAFSGHEGGFWYGYHVDSHTSLVGLREASKMHRCFETDGAVEDWLDGRACEDEVSHLRLFAYPAQSNMNGRRLPLSWIPRIQSNTSLPKTYTLLDAAAYAATSPLRLNDTDSVPDFTVLSFSKIFGFPDLGALIIKKDAAEVFKHRRYFGGGTVDMVLCVKENWHARKIGSPHDQLEDGTLPIHSILALRSALRTYHELFGSLERVAKHTHFLADRLLNSLTSLKHFNGKSACTVYKSDRSSYRDTSSQGPIIAFNLQDQNGGWVSNSEVDKLASIKDIHLRTGGVCNPGGISSYLNLAAWEMRGNFAAGQRCGSENDVMNGKPTGVIRVSLGAMSTIQDVDRFAAFVEEFFVDKRPIPPTPPSATREILQSSNLHIESLTVYPIKSCSGWQVPDSINWNIRPEGLVWDREWCIVKQGSGTTLSQKSYPRMTLIHPELDFKAGVLRIKVAGSKDQVMVPLSNDPNPFTPCHSKDSTTNVCGDNITARLYTSPTIAEFFTTAIGTPCTLARFPAASALSPSTRHSKAHLPSSKTNNKTPGPILLSNESPILTITRSSLNRLNETIKAAGRPAAHPSVFRANIVLAENPLLQPSGHEQPWAEDDWSRMQIGGAQGPRFEFLGGCRRCQMVCVDPETGTRNQEPFVTLAKTRRCQGRVFFGVHTSLLREGDEGMYSTIRTGDSVVTFPR